MPSAFVEAAMLAVFITAVALVYAQCFGIAGRVSRLGWAEAKLRTFDILALVAGFLGFLCMGYGLAEPYNLETTKVSITSKKLAAGSKPIRIVHITDLHCSFIERLERQLPTTIKALQPDIIVFTGDAANDYGGLERFHACMKEVSAVAPTFGVRGNHDSQHEKGSDWNVFGQTGVQELNCSSKEINVRGTKVWIAGVAVDNESCFADTLNKAPADAFTIFLYHYPIGLRAAVERKLDLFCGGHTHGGQVRLPWYGALLTNSELGKSFESGLYNVGETSVFISRGIGMIALPVRFLAPPEVAVIDVLPQKK